MEDATEGHVTGPAGAPRTMRAIHAVGSGAPEVLRSVRIPPPALRAGEVLIRTSYASVNFADIKARRSAADAPPYIPGLDVSGTVAAVGPGVEGLEPGQRVAAATDGGAYAAWVRARAELTYALPDPAVDLQEVAGIVAMMTAYAVLVDRAALEPGETVLVHAAAGGVGTLLLQLARRLGAGRVVAVVGSEGKAALVRDLGATDVLVSRGPGYAEALDAVTPDGVDVVADGVGGPFFAAAFARLAPFGRLVSFGNAAGDLPPVDPSGMAKQNLALIGHSSGAYRRGRPGAMRGAATRMLAMHAEGALRVPLGGVFDLEDAAEAHRAVESRVTTGKLLLRL